MVEAYIPNNNTYHNNGEFMIGYTNNGDEFMFDYEDYDMIKQYCWRLKKSGYLITNIRHEDKRYTVEMHRLIINNFPFSKDLKNYVLDHIDRNKRNNRRSNIRITERQKNSFNSNISKSNTSGVIGVCWHKENSCWTSHIRFNGKMIYLGSFHNIKEATMTRLRAEKEYFGDDFAPQRHLFNQYKI